MIRVTGLKWVPPFAQGHVRDFRVRWALEEVGLDYEMVLIDAEEQASAAYRAKQPFGQVPVLEDGDVRLFESGAILLHLAERTGRLLPPAPAARATALSWLFASLNSVEPALMNLAEVDYFMEDEAQKRLRRPGVMATIAELLVKVEAWIGDRDHLAGDFSIADLMLASVLRIVDDQPDLLDGRPRLKAYWERCLARPAFRHAVDAQLADFARHRPADMKWPAD